MKWTLRDNTSGKSGYLRLECDGRRVCDFFPFTNNGADEKWIRSMANEMTRILNERS